MKKKIYLTWISVMLLLLQLAFGQPFVHPGILHSREDLERMKQAVAAKKEPVYAGYQLFIQNPASQYSYKMQGPMAMVGRNPTVGQGAYDSDANAAHQNAVMWALTGDHRYAHKAIEIVNAWSATLQLITGKDAVLMAGLGPYKMVNAAELLRYTNAGWPEADIQKTEKHFREVIYPVLKNYAPFANGNWEGAAMKTVMAIGVFCNDRPMFETTLRYYTHGGGNGRLTNYIINDNGQIQESGRDQPHSQLGIGMLAECCAIAWNQGLDLYSYADNRLLKGFEYTAKYNLGNDDMPFQEWLDRTGKYHHYKISDKGRGELRAVYEQVYNHYVNRTGLTAPFTQQAAEKLRPEGPGKPGADHPGYGTLYFTVPKGTKSNIAKPLAPAGLAVMGSTTANTLSWVAAVGATGYTVKRATQKNGPYTPLAEGVTGPIYIDKQVKAGAVYYYTVSAVGTTGGSVDAYPASIGAGLPGNWQQTDVGELNKGNTTFDGSLFTVEGNGTDSTLQEGHFTCQPLSGDGKITVRYVPQLTSQFTCFGITIRESQTATTRAVSLVLYPGKTSEVEAPAWRVKLQAVGKGVEEGETTGNGITLMDPAVTFGRMTGYCWLRLQRKGEVFTGYISYNGTTWQPAGTASVSIAQKGLAGFIATSGMAHSTIVLFDKVSVMKGTK